MIELQDVGFSWPDCEPVLRNVSLHIGEGEKLVLLGANGSGKSSLQKLLAGLVQPDTGAYRYRGVAVTPQQLRQRSWVRGFRQEVGLVFQHPEAMLFNATVFDEIAYGPRKLDWPDVDDRVRQWADTLGLTPLLHKAPYSLSGGEKQKVALAAVLILEPKLLLLDEPSANLDPRTAGWLLAFLQDTTATVLVSTHNLGAAADMGERCLILGDHQTLCYDGPIGPALADPALLCRAQLSHKQWVPDVKLPLWANSCAYSAPGLKGNPTQTTGLSASIGLEMNTSLAPHGLQAIAPI